MGDQRPKKKGTVRPKKVKKTSSNRIVVISLAFITFIICITQFLGLLFGIYETVTTNEEPIRVIFLAIEILQWFEIIPSTQVIIWGIFSTISGVLVPIVTKYIR